MLSYFVGFFYFCLGGRVADKISIGLGLHMVMKPKGRMQLKESWDEQSRGTILLAPLAHVLMYIKH